MQPLLKDWAFARAAVVDLQDYLFSKELYWKLSPQQGDGAAGQLLSLTPGNLLLSLAKLNAHPWQGEQCEKLNKILQQVELIRRQWRSAWLKKCDRELAARLKLWQDYLLEASNEGGRLVDYPFQARWRAIIELLLADGVERTPVLESQIIALDERLHSLAENGPFVWEAEVNAVFPPDKFWFLYLAQRKR